LTLISDCLTCWYCSRGTWVDAGHR